MSKFKTVTITKCIYYEALLEIGDFLHTPKLNDTVKSYSRKLKEQGFTIEEVKKAVDRIINTFDRFPSYPEIKAISNSYKSAIDTKQEVKEFIKCDKSHARFVFCQDCMSELDLHCGKVCDYLTLNQIEVPVNYTEIVKTMPKLDMFKLILGDGIHTIPKIQSNGFNNLFTKTSKKSNKKEVLNEN